LFLLFFLFFSCHPSPKAEDLLLSLLLLFPLRQPTYRDGTGICRSEVNPAAGNPAPLYKFAVKGAFAQA
jgi:hypothetical protein